MSSNFQYYLYFNEPAGFAGLSTSGNDLDTANPFFLTYLNQSVLYDSRDDLLNTTRGTYLSLSVSEAGPPGQFAYLRIESDNRPKLYAAGRLAGGFIHPTALTGEEREAVPTPSTCIWAGPTACVAGLTSTWAPTSGAARAAARAGSRAR